MNEGAANPARGQKAQESSTGFKHTSTDVTSGLLALAVFGGFARIADVGSDDMMVVPRVHDTRPQRALKSKSTCASVYVTTR